MNELESLFHAGVTDIPAWLVGEGFDSVPNNAWWSSTTAAVNADSAWLVDAWGYVDAWPKTQPWRVWPVRGQTTGVSAIRRTGQNVSYAPGDDGDLRMGVPWPMPRFTDLGECLLARLTGLIWAKSIGGPPPAWPAAAGSATSLELCGHEDWRLPNRKELWSLVNYGSGYVADWLDAEGFITRRRSPGPTRGFASERVTNPARLAATMVPVATG